MPLFGAAPTAGEMLFAMAAGAARLGDAASMAGRAWHRSAAERPRGDGTEGATP